MKEKSALGSHTLPVQDVNDSAKSFQKHRIKSGLFTKRLENIFQDVVGKHTRRIVWTPLDRSSLRKWIGYIRSRCVERIQIHGNWKYNFKSSTAQPIIDPALKGVVIHVKTGQWLLRCLRVWAYRRWRNNEDLSVPVTSGWFSRYSRSAFREMAETPESTDAPPKPACFLRVWIHRKGAHAECLPVDKVHLISMTPFADKMLRTKD